MKKNIFLAFIFLSFINVFSQWKEVDTVKTPFAGAVIDCADNMHCMAVPTAFDYGLMVRKSSDGGFNWETIYNDTITHIYEYDEETGDSVLVKSISPKFVYAECLEYVTPDFAIVGLGQPENWRQENQMAVTRDGGYTWDSISVDTKLAGSGLDKLFDIVDIHFFDSLNGSAVTGFGRSVFITNDAGKTWEKHPMKLGKDHLGYIVDHVQMIDEKTIIAGAGGNLVKTTNDGKDWELMTIEQYGDIMGGLTDFNFVNKKYGWVSARKLHSNLPPKYTNVILNTTNGGNDWKVQLDTFLVNRPGGLYGIYFADKNNGLAWGDYGIIWRTNNSGENWIRDNSFPYETRIRFAFPQNNLNKILATTSYREEIWMYEDPSSVKKHSDPKLKIYPNPAREVLKISSEELTGSNIRAVITNSAGMKIIEQDLINIQNGEIDISKLPPGFYFLNIYSGGEIINKPFAVVR